MKGLGVRVRARVRVRIRVRFRVRFRVRVFRKYRIISDFCEL